MSVRGVLCCFMVLLPSISGAKLIELGRENGLMSIDGAFPGIASRMKTAIAEGYRQPNKAPRSINQRPRPLPTPYPIETDLTLSQNGSIVVRDQYQGPPVCIVGADNVSVRWLDINKPTLIELNANCIVIQARNDHEVLSIRKKASPIAIAAVSLNGPLSELGVTEYPVLILSKQSNNQLTKKTSSP